MNKFDTHKWNEYLMKINGLSVGLNMPTACASVGSGDTEFKHSLPPYHRRKAFLVDEYPACPADWMRSTGRVKSYFVPIIEGNGLWLDFNKILEDIPQHVGVVVSVQGVNAVTGLPCKDPQLEQYRDECPKHKKAFGPDRLCTECGYKWPKQNYISSAGTPEGSLWLDGFRAEDGTIRQYVLTAAKARGVAKAIIGDDRVFALGLSYFLTKEKRPAKPVEDVRRLCSFNSMGSMDSPGMTLYSSDMSSVGAKGIAGPVGPPGACGPSGDDDDGGSLSFFASATAGPVSTNVTVNNSALLKAMEDAGVEMDSGFDQPLYDKCSSPMKGGSRSLSGEKMSRSAGISHNDRKYTSSLSFAPAVTANASSPVTVKKMEIAAGARIDQRVYDDPNNLDAYSTEPEGIIVINYCSEAEAEAILAGGKVDLSGSKEGFLKNVPTGNPV